MVVDHFKKMYTPGEPSTYFTKHGFSLDACLKMQERPRLWPLMKLKMLFLICPCLKLLVLMSFKQCFIKRIGMWFDILCGILCGVSLKVGSKFLKSMIPCLFSFLKWIYLKCSITFHLFSLCNVAYKVITKLIANRL